VLVLYAVSAVLHLRSGLREEASPREARLAALTGVFVHATALVYEAVFTSHMPGFSESLSAVGLGVMVAYAWVDRRRIQSLGMYLAPVGAVMVLASALAPSPKVTALAELGASWWLPVHLGLVFAGIAGFCLELVVGLAQLVVRRRLKRKQLGGLARFPSLETLDRIQVRSLLFGLGCLALGIAAGGVWASSQLGGAWLSDPKVLFTCVIWLWYAASLAVRLFVGWHGRWSMILSLMGFLGLVFSVIGLDFVTGGFHAYGG
jgi:ABC-type transport system involved in cytochrome c biogenesis permease subunit